MALNLAHGQQQINTWNPGPGRHLFFGAKNVTVYSGAMVLLSGSQNNTSGGDCHEPKETAFANATDITIHGGFFGANAFDAGLDYVKNSVGKRAEFTPAQRKQMEAMEQEERALREELRRLKESRMALGQTPSADSGSHRPSNPRSRRFVR